MNTTATASPSNVPTEQDRARRALLTSGLSYLDQGYSFYVRGGIGRWLTPAEVLTLAEQGRLR